ncbi:MAG: UDP-3-O-(3-hydroxymyristoyl)glucosamine N-acyltransferase [Nitrospinota bacterium]|nr:UDP-3-O-(3-hydroxymyristoyl)glucosamine N-acyltransferase [Nitrospinota bacterium]
MNLSQLAAQLGAALVGDGSCIIKGAASWDKAGPEEISFVKDDKIASRLAECRAGALIIPKGMNADRPAIAAENPLALFSRALDILYPEKQYAPGAHPSASIGQNVNMGESVHVGPHVSIGQGSSLGARCVIMAGARIGDGCVLGDDCVIHENVVIKDGTRMGARCVLHPGSVVGSDGFGYIQNRQGVSEKLRHAGNVVLGDDVEIGACSSVDRAMVGSTVIKKGVKIDNQVQVAHNVVIGENTIIAGCSGIAGSTVIGANVMIGGAVAVSDHVTVADGVMIAGMTGVHTDLKEPGIYAGPMAMKRMEYKRFILSGKRLDKLEDRVKRLEKEKE